MAKALVVLVATHLTAAAIGYRIAPQELLDEEAAQSGFFTTDTKRVLSATVESLRHENKLLVYSYKGDARVAVRRSQFFGLLHGEQELIVPASIDYYLDLSDLQLDQIHYDEVANVVTVRLPALEMGDVRFQPEEARTINGGLLTFSQDQVDELTKINFASARRALTKQAQGATLVEAAKEQAKQNVESNFTIPLRSVGNAHVRVEARY